MDVTFRESEPYYQTTQSPLQGEKNEEVIHMPVPLNKDDSAQEETVVGRLDRPDLLTYTRRNRTEEVIMHPT